MLNGILIGVTALVLATLVAVMIVRHANRLGNGHAERNGRRELYTRLFDEVDARDVERRNRGPSSQ